MDASKLRNSCICGNTLPYLECCGPYADAADMAGAGGAPKTARGDAPATDEGLYRAFRHGLHEVSMALFPLRSLYQAYWEKLSREEYPHDMLMGDPEYGRSIIENFFWDYFVQYSDARPILRTARDLEGKDLRLSHDLMQWSYAPLWFYWVEERTEKEARLRNPGNGKVHHVRHGDRLPQAGEAVFTRLLPFRGREFCGHAMLALGSSGDTSRLDALFRTACRDLGVKPGTNLRPDVHGEEWRRHGGVFLALWRSETYDSRVGRPGRPQGTRAGDGSVPPMTVGLRDRENLAAALAGNRGGMAASETGPGSWDLRFRALRMARIEARGSNLVVTLSDPAFRDAARAWLRERLQDRLAEWSSGESAAAAAPAAGSAAMDEWVHAPQEALNGQTPIQASTHDWGRRRLRLLLAEMAKLGRDVASLRNQLGL
jgi:hypothetical protein